MSTKHNSGPLPISGHRKSPFDVPGQPKLEFPFIRAGYWEKARSKFSSEELPEKKTRRGKNLASF
jgi:hypothetical protein